MKKNILKVLSSTALITTLLTPSVFAENAQIEKEMKEMVESAQHSKLSIEQLYEKYDLKEAKSVPQGINPLKFDSVEEADKYFSTVVIQDDQDAILNSSSNSSEITNKEDTIQPLGVGKDVRKTNTVDLDKNANLKLDVTATYVVDGLYIVSVNSISSKLSGNVSGFEWSQSSSSFQRLDSNRTAGVTVKGVLTQYVIIDGKVSSRKYDKSVYTEFRG